MYSGRPMVEKVRADVKEQEFGLIRTKGDGGIVNKCFI